MVCIFSLVFAQDPRNSPAAPSGKHQDSPARQNKEDVTSATVERLQVFSRSVFAVGFLDTFQRRVLASILCCVVPEFRGHLTTTRHKIMLNGVHRCLKAKMVNFGGWDMPVEYSGIGWLRGDAHRSRTVRR